MNGYDVIVVGLGPAGAAACLELAAGGAKVLALDGGSWKRKPCGGCVSRRWEWLLDWLRLPAWAKSHPVRHFSLAAPGAPRLGHTVTDPGAYLLDRARLDSWLAETAGKKAAEILKARAESLWAGPDGFIVGAMGRKFKAPLLIAADGAGGICRRELGLELRPQNRYLAVSEEMDIPGHGYPDGGVVLELGGVEKGYAWLFARGERLNVGLGLWGGIRRLGKTGLKKAYLSFLARFGLGGSGGLRGAPIPCPTLWDTPRVSKGRALFVGDAAGLADPFLGEGIGQALFTGRLAAGCILAGDTRAYSRVLGRTLWREHRHAALLARLTYARPLLSQRLARRHPGSLELGFDLLRGTVCHATLWENLFRRIMGAKPALDPAPGGNYSKWLS